MKGVIDFEEGKKALQFKPPEVISVNCKSLKFRVGFILQISWMNCFREIKYHTNILAVHCNYPKSAKLNSNELKFMGKIVKYNTCKIQGFYSVLTHNTHKPLRSMKPATCSYQPHCPCMGVWTPCVDLVICPLWERVLFIIIKQEFTQLINLNSSKCLD